jgi:MFS family permease
MFYSAEMEQKISWIEIWTGIGLVAGPFISGILYEHVGYLGPFYFSLILTFSYSLSVVFLLREKKLLAIIKENGKE